jgi:hypothetical protein
MLTSLFVSAALALFTSSSMTAGCSISELRESPGYRWTVARVGEKVDSAWQIVRVRAKSADSAAETVTFQPIEWIRGKPSRSGTITLPGIAVATDDFNELPVPYQMVRPSGTRGSCHTREYRLGAQYLLLLREQVGTSTVSWWPLGPVNEQLRGDDDPWLRWVRERVARKKA